MLRRIRKNYTLQGINISPWKVHILKMIFLFPRWDLKTKSSHFDRVFHHKPSILWYPYFLETPIRFVLPKTSQKNILHPSLLLQELTAAIDKSTSDIEVAPSGPFQPKHGNSNQGEAYGIIWIMIWIWNDGYEIWIVIDPYLKIWIHVDSSGASPIEYYHFGGDDGLRSYLELKRSVYVMRT